MITGTIKVLEQQTGLNAATLSIILRLAEKAGQAKIVGYDSSEYKGKGRVPAIWEVQNPIRLDLA